MDWFQPYKHVAHSVGVIFVTVMNLPRSSRYIEENVVLVGIIPGPHEPRFTVNSYLEPLIDGCGVQLQEVKRRYDAQFCVLPVTSQQEGNSVVFLVIQLTMDAQSVRKDFLYDR